MKAIALAMFVGVIMALCYSVAEGPFKEDPRNKALTWGTAALLMILGMLAAAGML